jgi:endogenous inhibitor of DNA gyrase (YacG/DUF329 family)
MSDGPSADRPRRCPICGKPAATKHGPFCSPRCAMVDLGRWLGGDYRIATNEAPDDEAPENGA